MFCLHMNNQSLDVKMAFNLIKGEIYKELYNSCCQLLISASSYHTVFMFLYARL
jgi:hypothetical protein